MSCCIVSYPSFDKKVTFADNQWQVKAMLRSLEKQLKKLGILDQYNNEYNGMLKRKVIRKVTPQ